MTQLEPLKGIFLRIWKLRFSYPDWKWGGAEAIYHKALVTQKFLSYLDTRIREAVGVLDAQQYLPLDSDAHRSDQSDPAQYLIWSDFSEQYLIESDLISPSNIWLNLIWLIDIGYRQAPPPSMRLSPTSSSWLDASNSDGIFSHPVLEQLHLLNHVVLQAVTLAWDHQLRDAENPLTISCHCWDSQDI
jgi:hypothetical protein